MASGSVNIKHFINSLGRIITKGEFTPEIDGLRFLAIFPVVLMHTNTNFIRALGAPESFVNSDFNYYINFGGLGVRIFFAISGFVLSNAFSKFFFVEKKTFKEYSLKAYFTRRLTRLEPPFIVSTIVLFFFSGIFVVGNLKSILPNLLATLAYSHCLIYGVWSVINPVTWSLEIEIQFYLIAPFLGLLFFFYMGERMRNVILSAAIFIVPYLFLYSGSPFLENAHISKSLPVYFSHFLVGMLMSSIYTGYYWNKIKKSYAFDIICVFSVIGLYLFYPPKIGSYYLFDICVLLIMISSFKGKAANVFFSNKIISIIGGMCYSIYLIHYAVIFGLMKITSHLRFHYFYMNWLFQILLSLIVVLITSVIFYKFLERPFMDKSWPQKFRFFVNTLKNKFIPAK